MRVLKKILAWAFLVFALIFTGSVLFLKYNKQAVINVVTARINETVKAEISVRTIDLTFIESFPNASVFFEDVYCMEVTPDPVDTLFAFQEVYFEFSIWDLIRKDYKLVNVEVQDGFLHIKRLQGGTDNFHFWKEAKDTTTSDSRLSFPNFTSRNLRLIYEDVPIDLEVDTRLPNLNISGYYQEDVFYAATAMEGRLQRLKSGGIQLFAKRDFSSEFILKMVPDTFAISGGEFTFSGIPFAFEGRVLENRNHWEFSGKDLWVDQVLAVIPSVYFPEKNGYKIHGKSNLSVSMSQQGIRPILIEAKAVVSEADFSMEEIPFELSAIAFDASFTNGSRGTQKTSTLWVKNVTASTQTGTASGNITVQNLSSPTVRIDGNIDAKFGEVLKWISQDLVESASGSIGGNFSIVQRFTRFEEIPQKGLANAFLSGELALVNASWTVPHSGMVFTRMAGSVRLMSTGDLSVDRMEISTPKSSFLLSGKVKNALNPGRIQFETTLKSDLISLEELMTWDFSSFSDEDKNATQAEEFPFDFSVQMHVDKFTLNKLTGKSLTGRVWSEKGPRIQGNDIRFRTLEGGVYGKFSYHMQPKKSTLWSKGKFTSINIKQLFSDFDDFGQTALSHKNLSGKLTSEMEMTLSHNSNYEFLTQTLTLDADVVIKEGSLINYKPLENLSQVVDVEELKNVKFSELKNQIHIENGAIEVPEMTINSSALDLSLEGTHTFENILNYSIRLKLSDALGNRKKKNQDFDDFIIEEDREGTPYIWIKMEGPIDQLEIGIDTKRLGKGIKDEFVNEGQELSELLKGEDPETKKPKNPDYTFEWNEEPDTIPEHP